MRWRWGACPQVNITLKHLSVLQMRNYQYRLWERRPHLQQMPFLFHTEENYISLISYVMSNFHNSCCSPLEICGNVFSVFRQLNVWHSVLQHIKCTVLHPSQPQFCSCQIKHAVDSDWALLFVNLWEVISRLLTERQGHVGAGQGRFISVR